MKTQTLMTGLLVSVFTWASGTPSFPMQEKPNVSSGKMPAGTKAPSSNSKSLSTFKSSYKLGTEGVGGGDLVESDPIEFYQVYTAAREAKKILDLHINYLEFMYKYYGQGDPQNFSDDPEKQMIMASIKKMFTHKPSLREISDNLKIEVWQNENCKNLKGREVVASIVANEEGAICLSGPLLTKKLDESFFQEQLLGLILHEMAHLAGVRGEEEATSVQKALIQNLKTRSISTLYEDMEKFKTVALFVNSMTPRLYWYETDKVGYGNCGSTIQQALKRVEYSLVPQMLTPVAGFQLLSLKERANWAKVEFNARKLVQYMCSKDTALSNHERAQFKKAYDTEFNLYNADNDKDTWVHLITLGYHASADEGVQFVKVRNIKMFAEQANEVKAEIARFLKLFEYYSERGPVYKIEIVN